MDAHSEQRRTSSQSAAATAEAQTEQGTERESMNKKGGGEGGLGGSRALLGMLLVFSYKEDGLSTPVSSESLSGCLDACDTNHSLL